MWDLILLLLGLGGLWLGSATAVAATVELGKRHGLSQMFLGLTVLAIGTDLPELVVAVDGAFLQMRGVDAAGVVVGNAIGSAIAQGGLVLGIACLVGSFDLAKIHVQWDGLVLLLAIGLLALLAADGMVNRVEGAALSVSYGIYLASLLSGAKAREGSQRKRGSEEARGGLKIAGGLLVVLLSAEIVLQHAVALSETWGMSQTVVGVLIVGAGTSLPELALSLGAAAKGQSALSIGNVMGSNIFDVLLPVGMSSLIYPLRVDRETILLDLPFLVLLSVIFLVWASLGKQLGRLHAGVLIGSYVLYAVFRLAL